MHLVLLHGYLLQGTGSNVYVANIAKAWRDQGHAVTVVCQERQAAHLPFVKEYVGPQEPLPENPPASGTIRVVVPHINDLLPVYVFDRYEGYTVKTIPQMTVQEMEDHLAMTAAVLRQVALQGAARVLANHAMFGPVIAKRALDGTNVPYDVKIHGSAVEYTLVPNPHLMPYALEGLAGADQIIVGTRHMKNRFVEVFEPHREVLKFDHKLQIVPPGMDPDIFALNDDFEKSHSQFLEKVRARIAKNPNGRRQHAVSAPNGASGNALHKTLTEHSDTYDQRATDADLLERWPHLQADEPVILYFGKFLDTKGAGELLVTVPTILARVPQARVIFVGFGSYREHLEGMLQALATGDLESFIAYARAGNFVEEMDFSKWFRRLSPEEMSRITVTGILDHDTLRELLPLARLSVVPSKWAEPFGMVAVEAMAAGVMPLINNHAGLRDVVNEVTAVSPELAELISLDRPTFVDQLPGKIEAALRYLYPNGFGDQEKRRQVGRELRQISVEKFSWGGIARRLLG